MTIVTYIAHCMYCQCLLLSYVRQHQHRVCKTAQGVVSVYQCTGETETHGRV